MKKTFTSSLLLSFALIITSSLCNGQSANTSLSNLAAPTAANADLLPIKTDKLNLGSGSKGWKRLFITDGLYRDTTRIFAADTTTTAAGYHSLAINAGKFNTAVGAEALRSNSIGVLNTAVGASALLYNTQGSGNTATGVDALYKNTQGNFNTASGYLALALNTTGSTNVAAGDYALSNNTAGHSNIGIGSKALYKNQTQNNVIAIGDSALFNSMSGGENIAIGSKVLTNNSSGHDNVGVGYRALFSTSGNCNTALGAYTGGNTPTGSGNTAIGYMALDGSLGGTGNTALGYMADVSANTTFNATAIGNDATVDASNKVRIGNTTVTSIGGQVGWTIFSDGRYKKNIKENVPGLEFINALRPVTYTVDINGLNNYFRSGPQDSLRQELIKKTDAYLKDTYDKASKIVHTGFIAQEVEAAATKLNYDFNGVDKPETKDKLYGLRYDEFVVPLVKAVQELSKQNDDLKNQNETQQKINADLQKQIDELKALMSTGKSVMSDELSVTNSTLSSANTQLSAYLLQNQPNPTSSTTTIKYFIPDQASKAIIRITNSNGQEIKSVTISAKSNGQLTLQTNQLIAGTYFYSLVVDGKTADTKKMVIAH